MSRIKSVLLTISTKSFQSKPNSALVLYSSEQTKYLTFNTPLELPNTVIEFIKSETDKRHLRLVNFVVDTTNCTTKFRVTVLIGGVTNG